MITRSMGLLCLALTPAAGTWAQDLLACVDPDVKAALVFGNLPDDPAISRAVPEAIADLVVSDDLQFIGSSVSSFQVSAAYKTALDPEAALQTVIGALTVAGWHGLPEPVRNTGGFVSAGQPVYAVVCRNDEMMTLMTRRTANATFVSLNPQTSPGTVSCEGLVSPQSGMALTAMAGAHAYLPRLTLPPGAQSSAAGGQLVMASSAASGRSAETAIVIDTDLSAQFLLAHFARQLQEQGWNEDTGWSGLMSTGAAWSARPATDLRLAGLLEILALDAASYQATFRATRTD